mmetsp:Transcript_7166/g.20128  ORF Transcript_7166/g.20128 Transcript_7166/m.20128 type:complete len:275 (-) Transcript_7166:83-907(-)
MYSQSATAPLARCSGRLLHAILLLAALSAHGTQPVLRGRRHASSLAHSMRDSTVNVSIYYESLCPQSLNLLNTTLRQVFSDSDLSSRISLRLVPFGNAQTIDSDHISDGYKWWHPNASFPVIICQHHETECLGNMIHACAADVLKDPQAYVPFIVCMASYGPSTGVELTSYACGKKLGIDMESIKGCTYSERGSKLHADNGLMTSLTLNKSYVPWVVVNGKHRKEAEGPGLVDFLCGELAAPKPAACKAGEPARQKRGGEHSKPCGGGSGAGFF